MLFRAPEDPNPYLVSDECYPENVFDLAPTVGDPENDVSFPKELYPIFPSSLDTMSSHNASLPVGLVALLVESRNFFRPYLCYCLEAFKSSTWSLALLCVIEKLPFISACK